MFPVKPVVAEWKGVDEMESWLRVRDTDSLLLSERTVHLSSVCPFLKRGAFSLSRPTSPLTNCTDAFTTMWMTTSVCMSTAVARKWILQRNGYGRLLSCVGGAARFLRGHRRVCLIV